MHLIWISVSKNLDNSQEMMTTEKFAANNYTTFTVKFSFFDAPTDLNTVRINTPGK